MARLTFPQDRTTFIYGAPLQPILTPPRTALTVFVDFAATTLADIQTPDGTPIPGSIIYTGSDGLLPLFLGPDGAVAKLYVQVLDDTEVTLIEALTSDLLATITASHPLTAGHGPPTPDEGDLDSFYVDLDAGMLWGPKVDVTSWPNQPIALGAGNTPQPLTYDISVPTTEVVVDHSLVYPTVVYTDTEDRQELCDVSYPSPSQVVVTFGEPSTGRLRLF